MADDLLQSRGCRRLRFVLVLAAVVLAGTVARYRADHAAATQTHRGRYPDPPAEHA